MGIDLAGAEAMAVVARVLVGEGTFVIRPGQSAAYLADLIVVLRRRRALGGERVP